MRRHIHSGPLILRVLSLGIAAFAAFHPALAAQTLVFEGYQKDDPNTIIEMDKYRLVGAPTGQTMGGLSEERGSWNGQFFLAHGAALAR
jgi:hypothetical protein